MISEEARGRMAFKTSARSGFEGLWSKVEEEGRGGLSTSPPLPLHPRMTPREGGVCEPPHPCVVFG